MGKMLNGLEVSKLEQFINDLRTKPEVVKAVNGPWLSRIRWQEGLKSRAYMRKHVANFDEPEGLGATDSAASAHEHILSAVGACIMTGFIFQATLKGIQVRECEIAMEGTFGDIRNWAGLTDEGTPGYPEIKAKLYVKADGDPKELEKLWNEACRRSVVAQTVARGAKISTSFEAL